MATAIKNLLTQDNTVYHGDPFSGIIEADDPEGQIITYRIASGSLPVGITFDALAGTFTGTASLRNIDTGKLYPNDYTWVFSIGASDGVNETIKQWSITVKHHHSAPTSSTSTLTTGGVENTGFSQNIISSLNITVPESDPSIYDQTGYVPPVLTLTPHNMPGFLSLNQNGVLSGTLPSVSAAGASYVFTVTASNAYGAITLTVTLNVSNSNNPPVWTTTTNLGTFQVNDSISIFLAATDVDGESLTYSFVSGSLPSGVTVSGNHVSGTAPSLLATTTYTFTMSVTDGISPVTKAFTIQIAGINLPVVWNTASGSLGSVTIGQGFSFQFSATDPESQAITYSVTAGSLPGGLSLSGSGLISGTTNAVGTSNFTVGASDGVNVTNRAFSISVTQNLGPSWITAAGSLGSANQGTGFSYQLAASDPENDNLTYTVTSGSLPAGLTLSTSGLISGTMPANPLPPHTVVGYVPSQTTGNLVYDGGLTLGGSRWTFSGWHAIIPSLNNPQNSYYLYPSNSAGSGPINSGSGYMTCMAQSDKFIVSPNTQYTAQTAVYMTQIQSTGTINLDIEWFDSSGNSMGASTPDAMTVNDSQYYDSNTPAGPHYGYTGVRYVTVMSPASAAKGRLRLWTNGFHYVYPYLDVHYINFEVSQGGLVGFSDDATNGAPYNTPTPIYNYDSSDTTQFNITTNFTITVTDGTTPVARSFSINNIAT